LNIYFCERLFGQVLLIEKKCGKKSAEEKVRQEKCTEKLQQENCSRKSVAGKVRQKNRSRKSVAEKLRQQNRDNRTLQEKKGGFWLRYVAEVIGTYRCCITVRF
jgi:hypothetical protein